MLKQKSVSLFVSLFLIVSFLVLALPQKGHTGFFILEGCCQFETSCANFPNEDSCLSQGGEEFFFEEFCTNGTFCPSVQPVTNIPTLSEWGLVALAGVLGIIGFIAVRRRKVTT